MLIGKGNVNSVTWYDDYSFPGSAGYSFGSFSLAGSTVPQSAKIKRMVTGTLTRVLVKNDAVTDDLLLNVFYYDDFGAPYAL